jgi:flagellar biosynthetic protein FlhB
MAESSAGEKTLPASQQKKQRTREEGSIARSQDLCSAATLLAALILLKYMGPNMMNQLRDVCEHFFMYSCQMQPNENNMREIATEALFSLAPIVLPFMCGMMLVGVVINILQVGLLFTGKPLVPKFSKLNPFAGFSNLFSMRSLVELIKALCKIGVATYVTWVTVQNSALEYVTLMDLTPAGLVSAVGGLIFLLWWRLSLVLLVLGVLDYAYQYWQFERNLMMTVQEAKEELKEYEGDPRIKQRIRQIQRRIAMQRMMAEVPKADVVVTNPTHYAVALRYNAGEMLAPVVIAKGARILAGRIREIALENKVPIVQKPELARSLYKTVEIGQPVPEQLFRAVAEVLAYVYQIDRRDEKTRERSGSWKSAVQTF